MTTDGFILSLDEWKKTNIMTREEKIKAIIADTDKNYAPYYDVIPNLIREHGYKSGIEIGVFCGGHAEKILETGCELIGIDPYEMYEPGMPGLEGQEDWDVLRDLVMKRMNYKNYTHYETNSNDAYLPAKQCIHLNIYTNDFITEYFIYDFVFIDGLHTYTQLKKDLYNYSKLIRKGGLIACHDYNHPTFPLLTTAIDEFVKEHNAQLVIGPLHLVYMFKTW